MNISLLAKTLGLLASLALVSACSNTTVSAGGQEVKVGDEMHAKMLADDAFYDDPELQAYVNRVGQRLVTTSDLPNKTFTFTVVDSQDINAFALPGGYIYINRGLLAYLDNEAELAGVLGHEIGHITGGHHGRQKTQKISNQVMAATVYILTGSSDVADASTMYGQELISGFGREMELEADEYGAQYMHKSGYDTEYLLEVIGVLKNQEQFQRVKAKSSGKPTGTYHGLYATHPRNDQRLKTVIRTASELDGYVESPEVPGEFRRHIDGMVWGESVQGEQEENRYYHTKLGFTFEHPPGWTVDAGSKSVVAKAPDNSASVTITLRRRDGNTAPEAVLEGAATGELSEGKALDQAGLQGYTAVASSASSSHRLAVIDYNYSFLFDGKGNDFAAQDPVLLSIIESFRPIHPKERKASNPSYVTYIQVPRGATLSSLAAGTRIPDAEAQLRLINGFYPRGEPRTGDWIKTIKQ